MAVYQQLIATDFNFGTVTENLSNTIFKTTYQVLDPFLLNIESSGINCNYHFDSVTDINIPYSGDMLNKIALNAILPKPKAKYNVRHINDIFEFLEANNIDIRTKYYNNSNDRNNGNDDNDINFTNNKNAYNKLVLLINDWVRDTKSNNNKINNILKGQFNEKLVLELIENDPIYKTYISFKTFSNYSNNDFDANVNTLTSVVNNEWICKLIQKTLINYKSNINAEENITYQIFRKDFELLSNIDINVTLSEVVNNIMNSLMTGNNSDTILFKYLYEFRDNLTNTTTYHDFFKYLKNQIKSKYNTQQYWENGAILCYQLADNNNNNNKQFISIETLITNTVQQNILDNIGILLDKIVKLDQINTKDTLKILDMITVSDNFLGFKDITITCYNLNMMPIVTLIRLKEKLLEKCVDLYHEINILVSSVIDRIISLVCKKLQNLLPILLKNQHLLSLDNKLHIILKEKIITHDTLFMMLRSELEGYTKYNGISCILELSKEYLLHTEENTLICQINTYIDAYEKTTLGLDTSNLNTLVLQELKIIKRFVMSKFCINCLKIWETNTSTYDNYVNSIFANITGSNLLFGIMDTKAINDVRDNLLSEGYWNIEEYLEHLNINFESNELRAYIINIIKQEQTPIHTIILSDIIATKLLDKMTNVYLYKAAISKNVQLLEKIHKQNKKALTNMNKLNILEVLQDMYIGKQIKLSYVPFVGIKMIKKVDLYIGSQILCSDYGERMLLAHYLNDTLKNRDNYRRLTSENPLYVPLDLWFTRNYEGALPLCNLSNQTVMLRVTLRKLEELVQYPYFSVINDTNNLSKYIELKTELSFPGSILANYIILPEKNRNDLTSNVKYNVIELIQKMGPNYINFGTETKNFEFRYHPRRMVKTLFICTSIETRNNMTNNKITEVIRDIKISLDGVVRETTKPYAYYNQIQPYERFTASLNNNQAVYTFSINPENPQPLGCLDMSNIPSLIITFGISKKKLSIVKQIKINVYSSYYELLRFCNKSDFC